MASKIDTAQSTRIRIKIKAYDHKIIDNSAKKIIDTCQRFGARVVGPVPLPTEKKKYTEIRLATITKCMSTVSVFGAIPKLFVGSWAQAPCGPYFRLGPGCRISGP